MLGSVFSDVESHREGVRYGWDKEDGLAKFQTGSENEVSHIFKYEQALDALMRCSLNRKRGEALIRYEAWTTHVSYPFYYGIGYNYDTSVTDPQVPLLCYDEGIV